MDLIFFEPLPLLQAADAKTSGSSALLPPGGNRFNHLIKQGGITVGESSSGEQFFPSCNF